MDNDNGVNKRARRQNPTQSAAEATAALNRTRALELRVAGRSYREIGLALGVSHVAAFGYVKDLLAADRETNAQKVVELRELEDERLDAGVRNVMPLLTTADLFIVKVDGRGNEVREEAADLRLRAVDRLIKLSQRRAELHGLDAPKKQELTGADGAPLVPSLAPEVSAALLAGYQEIADQHERNGPPHA